MDKIKPNFYVVKIELRVVPQITTLALWTVAAIDNGRAHHHSRFLWKLYRVEPFEVAVFTIRIVGAISVARESCLILRALAEIAKETFGMYLVPPCNRIEIQRLELISVQRIRDGSVLLQIIR